MLTKFGKQSIRDHMRALAVKARYIAGGESVEVPLSSVTVLENGMLRIAAEITPSALPSSVTRVELLTADGHALTADEVNVALDGERTHYLHLVDIDIVEEAK